jgi:hypothetical protein
MLQEMRIAQGLDPSPEAILAENLAAQRKAEEGRDATSPVLGSTPVNGGNRTDRSSGGGKTGIIYYFRIFTATYDLLQLLERIKIYE